MKVFILIIGLFTSTIGFSQNDMKFYGDIQLGAGMLPNAKGMYQLTGGFNTILENNLYLRLGADFAFGGSNEYSNELVDYANFSLRFGLYSEISDKFAITPYLGFGYISGNQTTREIDTDATALALATSSASNIVSGNIPGFEISNRYMKEKFNSFAMPVGVDFHFHNAKIGFTTGVYYLLSEYSEIGLRVGITFGKL